MIKTPKELDTRLFIYKAYKNVSKTGKCFTSGPLENFHAFGVSITLEYQLYSFEKEK